MTTSEINPLALHAFLSWVKEHGLFSIEAVFSNTCQLGLEMFGTWSISRILNQPRPLKTLCENSRIPTIGLLGAADKMRERSRRFGLRFWDLDEEFLDEELNEPEEYLEEYHPPKPWWLVSNEELAYERFFETNPHRILDCSLDDLGAKEVDESIKSILPLPNVSKQGEANREFEKYIKERDIYLYLSEKYSSYPELRFPYYLKHHWGKESLVTFLALEGITLQTLEVLSKSLDNEFKTHFGWEL